MFTHYSTLITMQPQTLTLRLSVHVTLLQVMLHMNSVNNSDGPVIHRSSAHITVSLQRKNQGFYDKTGCSLVNN